MKALYLDDSVDTCDCCGRTGLKVTVAMKLDDGGILYYGRTCAARNSGKDQRRIKEEIEIDKKERKAAACAEFYAHPAKLAWQAKRELLFNEFGRLAPAEWIEKMKPESASVKLAQAEIASKYKLHFCDVY